MIMTDRSKLPLRCDTCGEIAISISSDGFNHRYNCIIHAYGRQAFGKFPKVDFMDNLIERQCEWLRKNRRRLSDGQKYGTKKLQVGPVPDGDKNE